MSANGASKPAMICLQTGSWHTLFPIIMEVDRVVVEDHNLKRPLSILKLVSPLGYCPPTPNRIPVAPQNSDSVD